MSALIDFESSWEKSAQREEKRKTRELILDKAKTKHEKEERKKTEAKLRGEDTWMLSSVNERIEKDVQVTGKDKAKKSKKKKKKEKKKKKKHSSSSDSESDSGPQWIEKSEPINEEAKKVVKGPQRPPLQRADWMMAPMDLDTLPGVTRAELRAKKQEEEDEKKKQQELINMPGHNSREINPYWKEGGTGLPEEDPSKKKTKKISAYVMGDCGVGWLKKALVRCHEEAEEGNKPVEEIAAEKYGSLKKLKAMLKEAEEKLAQQKAELKTKRANEKYGINSNKDREDEHHSSKSNRESTSRDRKDEHFSYSREQEKYERPSSKRDDKYEHPCSSKDRKDEYHNTSRDRRYASGDRDRYGKRYSKDRRRSSSTESSSSDDSRDRKYKSRYERSIDHRRSRSRERRHDSRYSERDDDNSSKYTQRHSEKETSEKRKSLSNRFKKPCSDSDSDDKRSKERHSESSNKRKNLFKKPCNNSDSEDNNSRSRPVTSTNKTSGGSWRKKGFMKPTDDGNEEDMKRMFLRPGESSREESSGSKAESSTWRVKNTSHDQQSKGKNYSSSESSSSSSSSSSESEPEIEQPDKAKEPEPVVILSEEEMNKLGAKILKAEIMGNDSLAAQLKAKLEAARQAKLLAPKEVQEAGSRKKPADKDDDEERVVVLTRTDKRGMVRPLGDREHPEEPRQGRRRKKQKVETHTGNTGDRARYFHDDDKHNLKSLVEQEKMGTAEDSNMMFARLAGRSIEKTNDDWQIDDVFIDRANKKESESKTEDRDRFMAIMEHKKMSKAIESCQFCFDRVPKHLIIAIGIKCYLCLPNHKSLTDGHCLIVPMQHATQGTAVDEDVWDEIKIFRKGLTKMFEEKEEDCVFMEMSRNLKYHPHMYLDCVPMPREVGDMAPIYFKKAIMESESEWAQNKKLVDLSQKDVRRSVPKGFPYFSVDFGLQGGFAHVIEDEKEFPSYFGREIIGGMLDVGPDHWRKPRKENFEEQRKKVLTFAEWWKPYDWTQRLTSKKEEDSS